MKHRVSSLANLQTIDILCIVSVMLSTLQRVRAGARVLAAPRQARGAGAAGAGAGAGAGRGAEGRAQGDGGRADGDRPRGRQPQRQGGLQQEHTRHR